MTEPTHGLGELGSAELMMAELNPFAGRGMCPPGNPPTPRGDQCPTCDGYGVVENDDDDELPGPCGECGGSGVLPVDDADHLDHVAPADHDYQLPGGSDA